MIRRCCKSCFIIVIIQCVLWEQVFAQKRNKTQEIDSNIVNDLVRAVVNDDVLFQPSVRSVTVDENELEGITPGTLAQSTEFDYINPTCMNESFGLRQFKISGGQFSEASRWPYLVSLQMEIAPKWYRHFCAGVLVSQMAVLTTAHCIKMFRSDLDSDFGNLSVPIYASFAPQCRHMQGTQNRVLINTYRVHQRYKANRVGHDIAVLKLEVAANETIEPVDFRTSKSFRRLDQFKKLHVVGWGSTSLSDHSKKRFNRRVEPLHHATLEAYEYRACQKDLVKSGAVGVTLDEKTMMCAFSVQSDTCEGDSGGPLLVSDLLGDPKYDILVGLTSFGPDIVCGGSLYLPGVYTKVSSFVRWIEDSLKQLKATNADSVQISENNSGPLPFVKFDPNQPKNLETLEKEAASNPYTPTPTPYPSSTPTPSSTPSHTPSSTPTPATPTPTSNQGEIHQKHNLQSVENAYLEVNPDVQKSEDNLDENLLSFEDRKELYIQECLDRARLLGTSLSDCG